MEWYAKRTRRLTDVPNAGLTMLLALIASVSLGFLLTVWLTCRNDRHLGLACILSAVVTVIGFVLSVSLVLQGIATCVAGLVILERKGSARRFLRLAVVIAVLSHATVFLIGLPTLLELQRLRRDFPMVSLSDRLAYERDRAASEKTSASPSTLEAEPENRDFEYSQDPQLFQREFKLAMLHQRKTDQFVIANGFGNLRLMEIRREMIELPESDPAPLPAVPVHKIEYPHGEYPPSELAELGQPQSPERLNDLHVDGIKQFSDPRRTGYFIDKDHVAGFLSHRISNVPELTEQQVWQVARLELVSLLRHEKPVVYVSSNLPNMNELRIVPTRPLNRFEQSALTRLQQREKLVINEEGHRIEMLGPIFARKKCLDCHSVNQGDLLGAFSYELLPALPSPRKHDTETSVE